MQSALAQDKNQGSVVQNYDQQQNNNQLMFNKKDFKKISLFEKICYQNNVMQLNHQSPTQILLQCILGWFDNHST